MPRLEGLRTAGGVTWRLRTYLELGALPGAVPCARRHATLVLSEWGLRPLASSVGLVVSELVTNALRACAGMRSGQFAGHWSAGPPPIRLWLRSDGIRVLIEVWDGGDRLPVRRDAGPDAESGRGLMLVEYLSTGWGSYVPSDSTGKVVWATVAPGPEHD